MTQLKQILENACNEDLSQIIISNKRKSTPIKKVVVKPFFDTNGIHFQFSSYEEKKVFHKNCSQSEAIRDILQYMKESFKQIDIICKEVQYHVLVNKKGNASIKKQNIHTEINSSLRLHNREKNTIFKENEPVPFLVELGVQTNDGKIIDKKYKKYRQINRFLEFIQDVLPELPKNRKLTIIDFGCGKSYLTFAMYYYLKIVNGYSIQMIGLDLKEDVINHCNQLAEKFGYEDLHFLVGDISSYNGANQVDMVVTLHACDTATDFALEKAVRWGAKVILSVPCCQHECNQVIHSELLAPILKYGILKERVSALLTDGIRANLLEEQGYHVDVLEFIDLEHTPKNILLRAIKKNGKVDSSKRLEQLCEEINFHGTLEKQLKNSK